MAIDLNKNKDALLKAYNEVVADKNDVDWAVFAYEGQTAVLKVAETGEGSIDDLLDDLNSSKIMYAYCKVMDPNTSLPKYVLINWQGEAAPESMKFKCANHLRDIKHFLRMVHVTINARTEDDIDEKAIIEKVSKSSGSQYSIHKEKAKPAEPIKPVGSVYQKTQVQREINIKDRDKFWAKTEDDEQHRLAEEKKQMLFRQQSFEADRKTREAKEAEEREKQVQERMRTITQKKIAERRASQSDESEKKKQWEKEQEQSYREEEERRQRSEQARKERAAEAGKLTASTTSTARSFFKRKESQSDDFPAANRAPPPPRKIRSGFGASEPTEPQAPREPVQLPTREPSPPPRQPSPPRREPSPPRREPSPPRREPSPPRREPSPPPREPSPPPVSQIPSHPPATRNLLAESLPARQADSDEEQNNDDEWGDDDTGASTIPAVQEPAHIPAQEFDEAGPAQYEEEETPMQPQPDVVPQMDPEDGLCVQALYDYQASDETEITFDPGDIIKQVEQIDPGWWVGTGPDGHRGMFPANFVEALE